MSGQKTGDTEEDMHWLVGKTVGLGIFNDKNGVMNRSVVDVGGEVLAVLSQFTLTASPRRGNRPSYMGAGHDIAVPLYEKYCEEVSAAIGKPVGRGVFGADMQVSLVNDGPVTIITDSRIRNNALPEQMFLFKQRGDLVSSNASEPIGQSHLRRSQCRGRLLPKGLPSCRNTI